MQKHPNNNTKRMDFSDPRIVPNQQVGQQADIVETMVASDGSQAKDFFAVAKKRLFEIADWGNISEGISAAFTLTDPQGDVKNSFPAVGDHIRINIPGPGSTAGGGYDWVRIELVQQDGDSDKEFALLKVRPSADPGIREGTAHFFDSGATSSFMVKREGNFIAAEIHGRNEKPNTESKKLTDKIRNFVVGTAATSGLSEIQWQKLAKGFLNFKTSGA